MFPHCALMGLWLTILSGVAVGETTPPQTLVVEGKYRLGDMDSLLSGYELADLDARNQLVQRLPGDWSIQESLDPKGYLTSASWLLKAALVKKKRLTQQVVPCGKKMCAEVSVQFTVNSDLLKQQLRRIYQDAFFRQQLDQELKRNRVEHHLLAGLPVGEAVRQAEQEHQAFLSTTSSQVTKKKTLGALMPVANPTAKPEPSAEEQLEAQLAADLADITTLTQSHLASLRDSVGVTIDGLDGDAIVANYRWGSVVPLLTSFYRVLGDSPPPKITVPQMLVQQLAASDPRIGRLVPHKKNLDLYKHNPEATVRQLMGEKLDFHKVNWWPPLLNPDKRDMADWVDYDLTEKGHLLSTGRRPRISAYSGVLTLRTLNAFRPLHHDDSPVEYNTHWYHWQQAEQATLLVSDGIYTTAWLDKINRNPWRLKDAKDEYRADKEEHFQFYGKVYDLGLGFNVCLRLTQGAHKSRPQCLLQNRTYINRDESFIRYARNCLLPKIGRRCGTTGAKSRFGNRQNGTGANPWLILNIASPSGQRRFVREDGQPWAVGQPVDYEVFSPDWAALKAMALDKWDTQ